MTDNKNTGADAPEMVTPKRLCRDCGITTPHALKAAELMAQAIADDVLHILQTYSVRPLHERIAEYFKPYKRES